MPYRGQCCHAWMAFVIYDHYMCPEERFMTSLCQPNNVCTVILIQCSGWMFSSPNVQMILVDEAPLYPFPPPDVILCVQLSPECPCVFHPWVCHWGLHCAAVLYQCTKPNTNTKTNTKTNTNTNTNTNKNSNTNAECLCVFHP